jgi:hypothetical protein
VRLDFSLNPRGSSRSKLETKAHSAAQKETPKPYLFITSFGQLRRTKFARATAQVTAANNKKTARTQTFACERCTATSKQTTTECPAQDEQPFIPMPSLKPNSGFHLQVFIFQIRLS